MMGGPTPVISDGRLAIGTGTVSGLLERDTSGLSGPATGESLYFALDLTVMSSGSFDLNNYVNGSAVGSGWGFESGDTQTRINGSDTSPAHTYTAGQTFRMVLRGTNLTTDTAALWIDPSAETDTPFNTASASTYTAISGSPTQVSFSLNNSTGSDIYIDNIVLATTFDEAIPKAIPEPATFTLFGAAAMLFVGGRFRRGKGLRGRVG